MKIKNKWLLFPGVVLFIYLFIRILDYGRVVFFHPLSNLRHDFYSYAPLLHFMKVCGFHASCSYWYNGFTTFVAAPPGWYFFAFPIYLVTDHLRLSYYISLVLVYVLIALSVWFLGKKAGMSRMQRFAFFSFFLGSNLMINVLRMGRMPELFAWLFFIIAFFILYYFKDKKLNNNIYWLIIPYTFSLLAYHAVAILLSFLILGLMLVKYKEQVYKLVVVVGASFLAASFWLLPLLSNLKGTSILNNAMGVDPWWEIEGLFHFTSLAIIFLPILTFGVFYFYYKSNKKVTTLLFFGPSLVLVLLFFLGLLPFFPVINHIFTNIYFSFMLFLILIFLFAMDYTKVPHLLQKCMPYCLLLGAVATIAVSLLNTPFFDAPTADQQKVISLLEDADGSFLVAGNFQSMDSHRSAYYSYAAIELDLPTASGHYPAEKDRDYLTDLETLHHITSDGDCVTFLEKSKEYKVQYYIGYKASCATFVTCGLEEVRVLDPVCLYRVPA